MAWSREGSSQLRMLNEMAKKGTELSDKSNQANALSERTGVEERETSRLLLVSIAFFLLVQQRLAG